MDEKKFENISFCGFGQTHVAPASHCHPTAPVSARKMHSTLQDAAVGRTSECRRLTECESPAFTCLPARRSLSELLPTKQDAHFTARLSMSPSQVNYLTVPVIPVYTGAYWSAVLRIIQN